MLKSVKDKELLLHTINLYLEIFGSVTINSKDRVPLIDQTKIEKVNWKILPSGETPWKEVKEQVSRTLIKLPPRKRGVYLERLRFIHSLNPDFKAIGHGGFNDYIVLGFDEPGIYIFECVKYGNAMYIIQDEWQNLSQKSKAELVNSSKLIDRVVHKKDWADRLDKILPPLLEI